MIQHFLELGIFGNSLTYFTNALKGKDNKYLDVCAEFDIPLHLLLNIKANLSAWHLLRMHYTC